MFEGVAHGRDGQGQRRPSRPCEDASGSLAGRNVFHVEQLPAKSLRDGFAAHQVRCQSQRGDASRHPSGLGTRIPRGDSPFHMNPPGQRLRLVSGPICRTGCSTWNTPSAYPMVRPGRALGNGECCRIRPVSSTVPRETLLACRARSATPGGTSIQAKHVPWPVSGSGLIGLTKCCFTWNKAFTGAIKPASRTGRGIRGSQGTAVPAPVAGTAGDGCFT